MKRVARRAACAANNGRRSRIRDVQDRQQDGTLNLLDPLGKHRHKRQSAPISPARRFPARLRLARASCCLATVACPSGLTARRARPTNRATSCPRVSWRFAATAPDCPLPRLFSRVPIIALAASRVDNARDMAAGSEHEPHVAAEQLRNAPAGVPGDDVVLLRSDRVGVEANAAETSGTPFSVILPASIRLFSR